MKISASAGVDKVPRGSLFDAILVLLRLFFVQSEGEPEPLRLKRIP